MAVEDEIAALTASVDALIEAASVKSEESAASAAASAESAQDALSNAALAETAVSAAQAAQAMAETVAANAQASALTCATWSALSALTATVVGTGAEVLDTDGGSHTDPVVGGPAFNAGRYTWSASPAGWERIGDTIMSQVDARLDATDARTAALRPDIGPDAFSVDDDAGNLLLQVTAAEIRHPQMNQVSEVTRRLSGLPDIGPDAFSVDDDAGNLLLQVTAAEIRHPHIQRLEAALADTQQVEVSFEAARNLILLYGQSLSTGQASVPPISSSTLAGAKSFVGGARPQDGGTDVATIFGSLVDYKEQSGLSDGNAAGETPLYGALQMVMQLLADEDGITWSGGGQEFIGAVPGDGGKTVAQLSSGTVYFDRLKNCISYGESLSDASGKSFAASALLWMQGEYDASASTPAASYQGLVRSLRFDAQAHAASVTGTDRPLPMVSYQTDTHLVFSKTTPAIALAQVGLSADPLISVAPSFMHLPRADGLHLTNTGSKWAGAYLGRMLKRWLVDGVKPSPMVPIEAVRRGRFIVLTYPVAAGRKLVIDTSTLPDPGRYGFDLVDSSGSALTVNSVSIMGRDKVQIEAAADVPSGAFVRYGWRRASGSGPSQGNLRDDDPLVFDPSGINKPMHSWANISETEIA